jgi:flagellar assembly protein FliH
MTNLSRPPLRPLLNIPPPAGAKAAGSYSRIIPAEELGQFDSWRPDALSTPAAGATPSVRARPSLSSAANEPAPPPPSAETVLAAAQARKAGYEEGYRDGLKALEDFKKSHIEKTQKQTAAHLAQWLAGFEDQWSQLEPRMAEALSSAAVRLARQVLRQELKAHPEHILALARDAVQAISQSARRIELLVHADDLALVQDGLGELLQTRGGRVRAEPSIARGGCRVQADVAAVDATLEQRWADASQSLGSNLPLADVDEPPLQRTETDEVKL